MNEASAIPEVIDALLALLRADSAVTDIFEVFDGPTTMSLDGPNALMIGGLYDDEVDVDEEQEIVGMDADGPAMDATMRIRATLMVTSGETADSEVKVLRDRVFAGLRAVAAVLRAHPSLATTPGVPGPALSAHLLGPHTFRQALGIAHDEATQTEVVTGREAVVSTSIRVRTRNH